MPGPGALSAADPDLDRVEDHLRAAERLFLGLPEPFEEGMAHVNRAGGALLRLRGRWDDARQRLRDALAHFQKHRELVEVTNTQLELSRVDRAAGETGEPAVDAVRAALATAEESRRPEAVRRAERELREVSPADYYARLHERARGRGADADPTSLITGVRASGTVLFLDVKNSSLFGRGHDPATVMLTINQLMAHVSEALRRHEGRINDFAGDGFLARFLGDEHARHAVEAGLEMNEAVREFNEPRDAAAAAPVRGPRRHQHRRIVPGERGDVRQAGVRQPRLDHEPRGAAGVARGGGQAVHQSDHARAGGRPLRVR